MKVLPSGDRKRSDCAIDQHQWLQPCHVESEVTYSCSGIWKEVCGPRLEGSIACGVALHGGCEKIQSVGGTSEPGTQASRGLSTHPPPFQVTVERAGNALGKGEC